MAREIRWPMVASLTRNAGDVLRGQAAHEPEGQGGPRLGGQHRVAGEEDQPQDVVLDVVDRSIQVGHLHLLLVHQVMAEDVRA